MNEQYNPDDNEQLQTLIHDWKQIFRGEVPDRTIRIAPIKNIPPSYVSEEYLN